jgi:lysophospholipase L1-like esterase
VSVVKGHWGGVGLALLVAATVGLAACGSNDATSPGSTSTSTGSTSQALQLVAIGDSIPNNSPQDCPGCIGFVDQYAKAVQTATGRPVQVANLSQHTGLTLPGLLDELGQFRDQLTVADVIVVGIAHNSNELNADRPCGKPLKHDLPDWSAMDRQCAVRSTQRFRPLYDRLYAQVAAWRQGMPTILRTINRYNDFVGFKDIHLTPAQERLTADFVVPWSTMICKSAKAHGFGCADLSKAFNGPDGLRPSGEFLADDYTHPSDKGNEAIARVLADLGYAPLA